MTKAEMTTRLQNQLAEMEAALAESRKGFAILFTTSGLALVENAETGERYPDLTANPSLYTEEVAGDKARTLRDGSGNAPTVVPVEAYYLRTILRLEELLKEMK